MRRLYLLLLFFIFFSCVDKRESGLPRLIIPEVKNVVSVNSQDMLNIYTFIPLACNFNKDEKVKELLIRCSELKSKKIPFDTIIKKYDLKIIIDTSYVVSNNFFEYEFVPRPKDVIQDGLINGKVPTELDEINSSKKINNYSSDVSKLMDKYVNCYPLLIFNNSNNETFLNSEFIQEAKDLDGKWKPIEFSFMYEMCGTGKDIQNILEAKKYFAFSIIKYQGNFKTKIRVKLRNNNHIYYSNEIDGFINRSQFDQSFSDSFLESYGSNLNVENYDYYKKRMFLEN
jgi:hypothetical protein